MDGQVDRPSEQERPGQTPYNTNSSLGLGWLANLSKQLQSIELFAQHGFYSWRNFLEAAVDKSTDTIRELQPGVIGATG